MSKKSINIVWFKRDLRLVDHEPIERAIEVGLPVVLVYVFEPSVMEYDDSDERHWRFVYQSIQEMQQALAKVGGEISIFHCEVKAVFEYLHTTFQIDTVFSHQEIGNKVTFDRDLDLKSWFAENNIQWKESRTGGVVRRLKSRERWDALWRETMLSPVIQSDLSKLIWQQLPTDSFTQLDEESLGDSITLKHPDFQVGGTSMGLRYLKSFLEERYPNYSRHISKP